MLVCLFLQMWNVRERISEQDLVARPHRCGPWSSGIPLQNYIILINKQQLVFVLNCMYGLVRFFRYHTFNFASLLVIFCSFPSFDSEIVFPETVRVSGQRVRPGFHDVCLQKKTRTPSPPGFKTFFQINMTILNPL